MLSSAVVTNTHRERQVNKMHFHYVFSLALCLVLALSLFPVFGDFAELFVLVFVSLDTGAQLSYTTGSNDARALVFPRRNWWTDLLICARKYYAVRV